MSGFAIPNLFDTLDSYCSDSAADFDIALILAIRVDDAHNVGWRTAE